MKSEWPGPVVKRSLFRCFKRNDLTWIVRESDSRGVPGAEGPTSLVFDCRDVVRRAWVFPRNWHQLDERDLWSVSERSGRISAKVDAKGHQLADSLAAFFESMDRTQEAHARAKASMAKNRALRAECRKLAQNCRAERSRMREAVQAHANELRTAGLTAEDASLYVASAVRETVAQVGASDDSAIRLESDASRWCSNAYAA